VKSLDIKLKDRTLRFDGVSVVSPDMVAEMLMLGAQPSQLRVTEETWEVQQHNSQVAEEAELRLPGDPIKIDLRWQLPEPYLSWSFEDLEQEVAECFEQRCPADYTTSQQEEALTRLADELAEVKKRGMVEFFKTVIYILAVFREKGVVWGVGRGSSCASFILFILGLHSVDVIRYGVPADEFFHD
jgi:DNA polymerase III alpha subunit